MKTRSQYRKGGSPKKSSSISSEKSVSSVSLSPKKKTSTPIPTKSSSIEEVILKKKTKTLKKKSLKKPKLIIESSSTDVVASPTNKYTQQHIVTMFLQMLNTVKLYHWKTSSYAQHKATDELYTNLNLNIDTFVEVMLGKTGGRVNLTGQKMLPLLDYTNVSDFTKEVNKYKQFLIDMNKDAGLNITNNSDLLNVRDEILGNLNQFTYLLTFK